MFTKFTRFIWSNIRSKGYEYHPEKKEGAFGYSGHHPEWVKKQKEVIDIERSLATYDYFYVSGWVRWDTRKKSSIHGIKPTKTILH
jgi:hypothetical protein